ncbi:MAG: S8 family serine peptidase [Gemmatales bacterium]|nr:S8 family serine peptidase [Gemmatales bacterium]MDW7994349.1 S8 family serine peptidase [Gemmatales bacterium]
MPSLPDWLQELARLLDRHRLLTDPQADGQGVRVCVVDTGVDFALLQSRCRERGQEPPIIEGARFTATGQLLPASGKHSAPHGTTVADVILRWAPRVQLFSADVFGPEGQCTVEKLVAALRWAVDICQCKLINLSLGIPEERLNPPARRQALQQIIQYCYHRDAVLVAAAHNDHPLVLSFPAIITPPLLSVRKAEFPDPLQFQYAPDTFTEFLAHSRAYLGPFAAIPATSWAAAHLTAVAARLLSLKPDLKPFEIKTLLYWLSRSL